MKTITESFDTLAQTTVTVFEDLDLEEIINLLRYITKPSGFCSHPFRKIHHSYQMRRSVYDMCHEVEYHIIERIWKEDGEILVTFIERDEGGTAEPETTEWTLDIDGFLHMVVGVNPLFHWK